MTPEQKAELIVKQIVKDFTDRRGLRQEWEEIDDGVQNEIIKEWESIALKIIKGG